MIFVYYKYAPMSVFYQYIDASFRDFALGDFTNILSFSAIPENVEGDETSPSTAVARHGAASFIGFRQPVRSASPRPF